MASAPRSTAPRHPASSGSPLAAARVEPQSGTLPRATARLFEPGTRCVHPQHGVVEVAGIVERDLGGTKTSFYELRLVASDGKILVPVAAAQSAGLRAIMSEREADDLLTFMRTPREGVDSRPFQKRMRIYGEMLRTGERQAIAEVLRDIFHTSIAKDLSFGERKLLTQARTMLLTEIAMAKHTSVEELEHQLEGVSAA